MLRGSGPQHESSGSVDSSTFPVSRGSSEAVVQQSSQLLLPSSARPDRSAVSETHVDNLLLGSYGQKHSCSPEEPIEAHPKSSNQRRTNRLRRKVPAFPVITAVAFRKPFPTPLNAVILPLRPTSGSRTKNWQRQPRRFSISKTQSRPCSGCSLQTGVLSLLR